MNPPKLYNISRCIKIKGICNDFGFQFIDTSLMFFATVRIKDTIYSRFPIQNNWDFDSLIHHDINSTKGGYLKNTDSVYNILESITINYHNKNYVLDSISIGKLCNFPKIFKNKDYYFDGLNFFIDTSSNDLIAFIFPSLHSRPDIIVRIAITNNEISIIKIENEILMYFQRLDRYGFIGF